MATKKKFAPRLAKVEAKPDPVVDLGLRFLGAIEDDEMLRRYIDTKARDLTMDKREHVETTRQELDGTICGLREMILHTTPTTADGRALCLAAAYSNISDVPHCSIQGNDVYRVRKRVVGARAALRHALHHAFNKLHDKRLTWVMFRLASADFLSLPEQTIAAVRAKQDLE